jgi:hypothetical protein
MDLNEPSFLTSVLISEEVVFTDNDCDEVNGDSN